VSGGGASKGGVTTAERGAGEAGAARPGIVQGKGLHQRSCGNILVI